MLIVCCSCSPTPTTKEENHQNQSRWTTQIADEQLMKADPNMAKKIVAVFRTGHSMGWIGPRDLRNAGLEGATVIPGLLWLIQHGESPVIRTNEVGGPPEWLCAATVLGLMKDDRFGDALVQRLDSPQASSWRFVTALGNLHVKKAVPYLVKWLHDDRRWEITSQAFGTDANYMLPALNSITGKDFSTGVSPMNDRIEDFVKKKAEILGVVDRWWSAEGSKLYGSKLDGTDQKKIDNKPDASDGK